MWRTVSSLELLPVGAKTELAETLLKRVKLAISKRASCGGLSRLAARKLFYGPANLVIPARHRRPLGGDAAQHSRPPVTPWLPWPAAPTTPCAISP